MPTYNYKCKACGHILEIMQSIKSAPKKKCPKCGKKKLMRLISGGGGIIFKGDGFYRSTDYINDKFADKDKNDRKGSTKNLHTERRIHKESL